MTKRFAFCITFLLLAALGLTGCGGGQPVAYAPTAYGVSGQCYYLDDPAEAIALQNAGLCPHTWAPTLMPLLWHQMYYPYYSSPAYYGTYVIASHRTVYVSHQTTFQHTYASQIKTESSKAKYKGSDGKTYTGNKIKPGKFSNGKKGFGGGKKCGLAPLSGSALTKGGGGSSGGSRSGGSSGGSKGYGGGSKGKSSGSTGRSKSGGC